MFFRSSKKKSQKKLDELCTQADIFIQVHFVRERNGERYKFKTLSLKDNPEWTALEELLAENGNPESFSDTCQLFLRRTGTDENIIADRAGLENGYFTKLQNTDSYRPSKQETVLLCLAMCLNIEEAKVLLKSAGYALSNSENSDLVIRYFLENQLYKTSDLDYVLNKLCETDLASIG